MLLSWSVESFRQALWVCDIIMKWPLSCSHGNVHNAPKILHHAVASSPSQKLVLSLSGNDYRCEINARLRRMASNEVKLLWRLTLEKLTEMIVACAIGSRESISCFLSCCQQRRRLIIMRPFSNQLMVLQTAQQNGVDDATICSLICNCECWSYSDIKTVKKNALNGGHQFGWNGKLGERYNEIGSASVVAVFGTDSLPKRYVMQYSAGG